MYNVIDQHLNSTNVRVSYIFVLLDLATYTFVCITVFFYMYCSFVFAQRE